MDLVPFHKTLSPATERGSDTAATASAAAAAATTTISAAGSRSWHCVFQHEAIQVRGHYYDQFQKKSADQPLSIKI